MKSIWRKDVTMPEFPQLTEDIKVDVAVVGGGMCGLLLGHFLKEQGAHAVILEKDVIAGGVTQNTTAKITAYHGLSYGRRLARFGVEKTAAYLAANEKAVAKYKALASDINCQLEEKDNYVYTMEDVGAVLAEAEAIAKIGGNAVYTEHVDIPLGAACAVKAPGQAQFHPLQFAAQIAAGQQIFEKTFVSDVKKRRYGYQVLACNALGQDVKIHADKVIIATHFPFIDRWGLYFMKLYQQRSYVLALEHIAQTDTCSGMYIGNRTEKENPLNLSFRTYGNLLLLGGGGGRTGKKNAAFSELETWAKALYPDSTVTARWAAQDCMSLDEIPYIGPYARGKDGLLVASGFNKWGMTGAMTAAMLLTGNLEQGLAEVFLPQRQMMRKQLFINGFETTKNFLRPTPPRCTHLGCALRWNAAEKSWDCPCHGSRFAEGGIVADNPAQIDLKR